MADEFIVQTTVRDLDTIPLLRRNRDTLDLHYPQLLLETSFDSLINNSYPSRSKKSLDSPSMERTRLDLEDSWASLGDSRDVQEEDLHSESTDVGSLLDVRSTEDVQSVQEDDLSSEASISASELEDQDSGSHSPKESGYFTSTSSGLTLRPQDGSLTMNQALLSENSHDLQTKPTSAVRDLKNVVKIFQKSEIDIWSPAHRPENFEQLIGTIQLSISEFRVDVTQCSQFRLLLLGKNYSHQWRDDVAKKIADSLVFEKGNQHSPSTSTSRYHIIPSEFGPGSSPDFADLIPIEAQLVVEHYNTAYLSTRRNQRGIILANDDSASRVEATWNGEAYAITDPKWELPDLAVVCTDKNDSDQTRETLHLMLKFSRLSNIPTIILQLDDSWSPKQSFIFTHGDLQKTVEYEPRHTAQIIQTLPVSLELFLNLDSSQLNRHIAYLTYKAQHPSLQVTNQPQPIPIASNNTDKSVFGFSSIAKDTRRILSKSSIRSYAAELLIVSVLLFAFTTYTLLGLTASQIPSNRSESVSAMFSTSSSTSFLTEASIQPNALHQKRIPSAETPTLSGIPQTTAHNAHFQIEMIGNSHLVVRTPTTPGSRKTPGFKVDVIRGSKIVETTVQQLFAGVYSVRFHSEEAYGVMTVYLSLLQPGVAETFTIDFGVRPRAIKQWQQCLMHVYSYVQQATQTVRRDFETFIGLHLRDEWMDKLRHQLTSSRHKAEQVMELLDTKFTLENLRKSKVTVLGQLNLISDRVARNLETWKVRVNDWSESAVKPSVMNLKYSDTWLLSLKQKINTLSFWSLVRDGPRSETLATAQDRASHIANEAWKRWKKA